MASHSQRAMALILALLFLATSVATGAVVIWQIRQDNKAKEEQATTQSTLDQLNEQEKKNMLQGTKLADYTPVEKVDTLQKIDLVEGTGEVVTPGARVTAHYTGALAADGTIFQSSHDSGKPIPFGLNEVIKGWTEGVPGMKVGGKRRLLIPYTQAYGETGRPDGGIPARADLVFDIEIVAVEQ